jgi:Rab proteins geranylgeranyltransferase component A
LAQTSNTLVPNRCNSESSFSYGYTFRRSRVGDGIDAVHNRRVSPKRHGGWCFELTLPSALAKAGFKVAHVDQNSYYGADEASLAQDELLQWSRLPSSRYFNFIPSSENPLPFSRSYSLSLAPALIPSSGPLINALILSGVSRYGQFKLLDAVFTSRGGALERVPANKEDIFKARDISLLDKRKLMRFLQFGAGDFEERAEIQGQQDRPFGDFLRDKFSLDIEAREAILYALAYCSSSSGE